MAKIAKNGQNRCQNGQMLLLNTFHFIILDFGLKTRKNYFPQFLTILTPFLAKRRHFSISATCHAYTYLWTTFRVFCRTKTLKKYFQHFWATLTTFLAKRHHITISAIGAQVRTFRYFVRLSLNFVGKYLEKMEMS